MLIEILPADTMDLNAVLQLQKQCYLSEAEIYDNLNIPPLLQDLESLADEFKKSVVLIAKADEEIVGSVRAYTKDETCNIGRLIVRNDFQNKGLGKRLMLEIEDLHRCSKRYELFTGKKSLKNLHFYNILGYKEFKQEKIDDRLTLVFLEKYNWH